MDGIFTRPLAADVLEKLHARADDPDTSRQAARRVVRSRVADTSWDQFEALLTCNRAGLTCNEAGALLPPRQGPTSWATEFNKRVATWEHWGKIVCTLERDGSRVWRLP